TVALEQDNISITLGFSNIFAIVHNKTFSLYLFLLCLATCLGSQLSTNLSSWPRIH
ncbi:hypothetical protein ACJX0J_012772, partial [Zea mays]